MINNFTKRKRHYYLVLGSLHTVCKIQNFTLTKIPWNQQLHKRIIVNWFHELFYSWENIFGFSALCSPLFTWWTQWKNSWWKASWWLRGRWSRPTVPRFWNSTALRVWVRRPLLEIGQLSKSLLWPFAGCHLAAIVWNIAEAPAWSCWAFQAVQVRLLSPAPLIILTWVAVNLGF